MNAEMELVVDAGGGVRCIYDESLDLRALGKLQITRASHVEPDTEGCWFADMGPIGGPVLGPFGNRSEALAAERGWLAPELFGIRFIPTTDARLEPVDPNNSELQRMAPASTETL
jgi:hypothetical protein